jgi:hypothetical protein
MNKSTEVDAWFENFEHPLKDAMLLVRDIILKADDRMTEVVKWSTPTFVFKGNLASLQPRSKRFVSLMFHHGATVPGDHPFLEGDAAQVRVMRLADIVEVGARRKALEAVVRSWCELKAG